MRLTGTIPTEIGTMAGLTTLALSYNDLIGPIPDSMTRLTSLGKLYLANNRLVGPFPMLNLTQKLSEW